MIADPGLREWSRPIHAAGMDGRTYRTGFADTVVAMEDEGIRRDFPSFRRLPALHGCGVWLGQLRPIAKTYDIRVDMAARCADSKLSYPWRAASVRVLDGAVRPTSDGFPVPHLYGAWDDPRGAELCLYYPPDETMLLGQQVAQQLLPWAFEWLHYYEIWLVTGVWSGPEAPHKVGEPPVTNGTGGETRPASVLRPIHAPLMGSMGYLLAQVAK
ncbi:hypothetical protein [Sphingopyxis witflariensis]|nr:hypothetical protein [Sphingopyxis witflariensis]